MGQTNSGTDGRMAWLNADARMEFEGATVLLVEDDPDIRDLMDTLLKLAGFSTTSCSSAEAALEELREQQFDMLLTDYMLPRRTGGWLLRQALEEGLLDDTSVLVLTAHPNPPDVDGFEVVQKPFDLEDLVTKVRQRLGESEWRPRRSALSSPPPRPGHGNGHGDPPGHGFDCPDPVELILYVSAHSPRTASAIQNIKSAVARFAPDRVKLTICDLSKDPAGGANDSIAFTPTLVKRSPGPRTFILGHITNPEIVAALLESCGEESA